MPMNTAIKRMSRKRRQAEGRFPQQPTYPAKPAPAQFADDTYPDAYPGSYEGVQDMPLTFAYTYRGEGDRFAVGGEQQQRNNLFIPPAFDPNELVELPTSYKPDTELDPIPQSDEFAEGLKIRPWAHVRVPSYLAISEWLGGADDEFRSPPGKAQFDWLISQYVGKQHPIDVSPLIPEVEYTTYGSLNQLEPGMVDQFPSADGYIFD